MRTYFQRSAGRVQLSRFALAGVVFALTACGGALETTSGTATVSRETVDIGPSAPNPTSTTPVDPVYLTQPEGPASVAQFNYSAFQLTNSELESRSDLVSLKSEMNGYLQIMTSSEPLEIEYSGVRLAFEKEIAELLDLAAHPSPSGQPVRKPDPVLNCDAIESFDLNSIPGVSGDFFRGCLGQASRDDLKKYIGKAQRACTRVREPESAVNERSPGQVGFLEVSTLDGLVITAGEALSHISYPDNWVNEEFIRKMRQIIVKIRHDDLLSALDDQIGNLQDIDPNCLKGTSSQNQAFLASTQRMINQLGQARSWLVEVERQGRMQAEEDRQRVLNSGRYRAPLPYPSLTDDERKLVATYLGGIYWRMRGGGLMTNPKGTFKTRIYFTYMAMSALGNLLGGSVGQQAGQDIFFDLFEEWGRYMDIGRGAGGGDKYQDLLQMTKRGLSQVDSSRSTLRSAGFDDRHLVIGGLQMGPCYYYAWENLSTIQLGGDLKDPYSPFLEGPTSWGEACTGAALGLGLAKSLLSGTGGS